MQHVQAHVPVTALAWYGERYILAGEGGHLVIYSADGPVLSRSCIFVDQAIHGITILDDAPQSLAIVWGGPLLRPVSLTLTDRAIRIFPGEMQSAKDWILDASFASATAPLAAYVSAHNAFSTLRIHHSKSQPNQCPEVILKPQIPGSNCVLYSAHLKWLSDSHCLIASGTAFGDVIVWSVIIDKDEDALVDRQVHFSFSAHVGSVFGVRLSTMVCPGSRDMRTLLASCSDDRTVRLWDVSNLDNSTVAEELPRDTGFGDSEQAELHAPPCLAKAMGHISRIWHVRFAKAKQAHELLRIRSFGEDSSVITWAVALEPSSGAMNQIHTMKAHTGKNIWAVACEDESDLVATGGADGAIAVSGKSLFSTSIAEISGQTSLTSDAIGGYRSYGFVSANALIATTDRGNLVLVTVSETGGENEVEQVSGPIRGLGSYSLVCTAPSFAFFGGTDGTVYVYHHKSRNVCEIAAVGGKISGLFARKESSGAVALLVCTVNSTAASLFMLEQSGNSDRDASTTQNLELELGQGFVTTSFTHGIGKRHDYFILGSRSGSIAVYTSHRDHNSALSRSQLLEEIHGKEAVTDLQWVASDETTDRAECHFLLSTGRDGTVAVHKVTSTGDDIVQELVHQLSLPFRPNVEGLSILRGVGTLGWGFRSKEFVVFDITSQKEVMAIECGGVHRNWAFQPTGNGGQFVWTKASKLFRATQTVPPYDLIRRGGHGREIKSAAISAGNFEQIIATGAEDTDIKLFVTEGSRFRCVQTLRRHNTGIQHLQWHGSYLFSSGGFEEFFVWRINPRVPVTGVGVICESAHPRSGTSDLRIMGFDVQQADAPNEFVIATTYSDSTLKHWRYGGRNWELLGSGDYLTSCLTQVFGTNYDKDFQLTAATDGHIIRWTADLKEQTMAWKHRHQVHQNSIHEAQCVGLGGGELLVISGGDDNAIGLTRITDTGELKTSLIARAHAAAVTGLAIVRLRKGVYGLVSASIDQRVKLWQIEIDSEGPGGDGLRVQRLSDVFTAVADVSGVGLCAVEDGRVGALIYGVGMDVWRLPWTKGDEY